MGNPTTSDNIPKKPKKREENAPATASPEWPHMRLVAASADRVSASAASTNGESRGDLRGADGGASRAFRPVQGGCFELLLGAAGAALRNFSIFFFFFF